MLSELEGAVLHLIHRKGPMTAYAVRDTFRKSPTHSWRASAGSTYPLIRKLVKTGYISEKSQGNDGRGTKRLTVTDNGTHALHDWVLSADSVIAQPVADPIRTRSYFLDTLAAKDRAGTIAKWRSMTCDMIAQADSAYEKYAAVHDNAEMRAIRGTLLQLQARLDWIDEIAREFRSI